MIGRCRLLILDFKMFVGLRNFTHKPGHDKDS